jgi:putative DNA primase/helicase
VLDQDKDTPPAELIAAVFETIRLVQREAKRIRETGSALAAASEGRKREFVDEDGEPLDAALDYYMPKGRSSSSSRRCWRRSAAQSEQSGKPAAIAALRGAG